MKVTQVIKEAITSNINAKCDEANKGYKLALTTELDRLTEERRLHLKDLESEYEKAFKAMLDKLDNKKITYYYAGYHCDLKDKQSLWNRNSPSFYITLSSDYAEDLKNKISENEAKAKKFINDIILELELGANKPNLDTLLNNVKF